MYANWKEANQQQCPLKQPNPPNQVDVPHLNTTLFMVFSVTNSILRRMLGYTNDQQHHY